MARCRSRINKDPIRGMRNRQYGLSRKAHLLHKDYNADVLVVIRRPDGRYTGYQSKPGLLRGFTSISDEKLLGPSTFTLDQESDNDAASQSCSMRSSSVISSTSAGSVKTPSLSSGSSSLSSFSETSPSADIPPPAPTPPPGVMPSTILPSIETPSMLISAMDPDMFLSFIPNDMNTPFIDNEITELLWPSVIESSDSVDLSSEPHLAHPNPVSALQQEAILSLLDQYF